MRKPFIALHARTFCHATEDPVRVKTAFRNTVGPCDIKISRTEGYHGNPIIILETTVEDLDEIAEFFSRLSDRNLQELLSSLNERIDESCNLFVRIDKQLAYGGEIMLTSLDDVVSVRIRVRVFPSKTETAIAATSNFLDEELSRRKRPA